LARAKNTSRSEARRRTRVQTRADLVDDDEMLDDEDDSTATAANPPRKPFFTFPDIRADVRGLPDIFRSRRLLWIPFILLAVGFVLVLIQSALPVEIQPWVAFYVQYFVLPQSLFTYFIGGFLAPRASYLIGTMLGLATGLGWAIVLLGPAEHAGRVRVNAGSRLAYRPCPPRIGRLGHVRGRLRRLVPRLPAEDADSQPRPAG